MTGTIKQDAEGMAYTIADPGLPERPGRQGKSDGQHRQRSIVDAGVAKIRVPYATYTGE